jgi:hypothetical protein
LPDIGNVDKNHSRLRATNHQLKKHTFEIESGYDLTTQTNANDGYYINLGYRWRF